MKSHSCNVFLWGNSSKKGFQCAPASRMLLAKKPMQTESLSENHSICRAWIQVWWYQQTNKNESCPKKSSLKCLKKKTKKNTQKIPLCIPWPTRTAQSIAKKWWDKQISLYTTVVNVQISNSVPCKIWLVDFWFKKLPQPTAQASRCDLSRVFPTSPICQASGFFQGCWGVMLPTTHRQSEGDKS